MTKFECPCNFAIAPTLQKYVLEKIEEHHAKQRGILLCVMFFDFLFNIFFESWSGSKSIPAAVSKAPVQYVSQYFVVLNLRRKLHTTANNNAANHGTLSVFLCRSPASRLQPRRKNVLQTRSPNRIPESGASQSPLAPQPTHL